MVTFIKRFLGIHKFEDPVLAGRYPYLVTGCARSGTHFVAAFLKSNALEMGHEATGAEGTVAWLAASEKYCEERNAVFEKKLHLIRHPGKVLASLQTINVRAWNYIFKYSTECRDDNKIAAAAKYWMEWNRMAKANAVDTVRIEDFEETPEQTCLLMSNFFNRPISAALISAVNEKRDSRASENDYGRGDELLQLEKHSPATFAKLLECASKYNYSL